MLCKSCFKVKVKSDEILKSKFDHIFKFCDEYLIFLFVLLLCEGAYSYKYVNGWNKFEKPFLQNIQNFSISLHFAKASEIDWRHPKIIYNTFEIKNLVIIPIYISKLILFCVMFFNILSQCALKFDTCDPCHSYAAPGLLWSPPLKKDQNLVWTICTHQLVLES